MELLLEEMNGLHPSSMKTHKNEELIMLGQMCWLDVAGPNSEKILHLRKTSFDPWFPYTAFPLLKVPDYKIPGGSKGWSTYQKLRQAGWVLIPTSEANVHEVVPHLKSA